MTWTEFHTESEQLASSGEAAFRSGDLQRALELYRRVAEAESKALEVLPAIKLRTIGITAVSAVALWYKAREYAKAAKLAHKWLGGDGLPAFAVDQLNHLLQLVWTSGAADRAGVRFVPGDVVVAVKGGTVVHGGAPLDLIVHKIDEIQAIYYRTIEMLLNRPLRRRGAPPPDVQELFRPWLFQAPAGSYQFAVRIQEPPQRELFPGSQPSVDKVTSTFLAIIMATATDPLRGLTEVVEDPEYRTTFLKLARNLAPTGKRFTEVEIRDASTPAASAIFFNPASREAINVVLRQQRPSVIEEENVQIERLTGVLRAVHLDEDWLELATDNAARPHVRIDEAGDALDDVVGPMVNRRVLVTITHGPRNRLLFKDIEAEE